MGNCCEVVDTRLEELLNFEGQDTKYITPCHSRYTSYTATGSINQDTLTDEVHIKLAKYRYQTSKLNTILEDSHEDLKSSPFHLKGVKCI
ncbi:hypothetical protein SteCoe_12053 [Stentor coeruleus]|uniref:Uncharacterized protein n=1 Tax=Stentor coeruleus TaxID=5963 RepID=A0A1R2CBL8_9CILI|nr:hypothetical protein SteCoe_12053 [Stentor coeruleus]